MNIFQKVAVRVVVIIAIAAAVPITSAYAETDYSPGGCQQQSFLDGDHQSADQIARLAQQAGFSGDDLVTAVAVAKAESVGWTHARLINADCSVDRGLWQINSRWHGEVSDDCAFDPSCNAQAAHTIWASSGWAQWVTYTNGAYQTNIGEAQGAVAQVRGGSAENSTSLGPSLGAAWRQSWGRESAF